MTSSADNSRTSLIHAFASTESLPGAASEPQVSPVNQSSAKKKKGAALEKSRRITLYFLLVLVFLRFSSFHQMLEYKLHIDLYILYFVGIPAFLGIPLTNGFKRVWAHPPARYWTAFALWLITTTAFSAWRSGSIAIVQGYYKTEFLLLFAIGALVATWREFRWLMFTMAGAAALNVILVLLFRQLDDNGRTYLPFGTVANANDYSAHLVFVLPFVLWVIFITKSSYLRFFAFAILALGLFEVLAAGSRGALLSLISAFFVLVFGSTAKIRKTVLIAVPVLAVVLIAFLPSSVKIRMLAYSQQFPSPGSAPSEALESSESRKQVLKDSIAFTIQHPLLGLGPGQFENVEGETTMKAGKTLWLEAHNSFAQIASENGLPGIIFYLGGTFISLLYLNKMARLFAKKRDHRDALAAAICVRMVLISFCVVIFFVNFGYFFYLPALSGIVIAMAIASKPFRTVESAVKAPANSAPTPTQLPEVRSSAWSS